MTLIKSAVSVIKDHDELGTHRTQTTGGAEGGGGGGSDGPISPLAAWVHSAAMIGQISASVLNTVNGTSRWSQILSALFNWSHMMMIRLCAFIVNNTFYLAVLFCMLIRPF